MILAMSIPCWLIPLLTGLICGVLGYLLGRLLGGNKDEITRLQTDLENCRNRSKTLQSNLDTATANAKNALNADADLQARLDAELAKNNLLQNELEAVKENVKTNASSVDTDLQARLDAEAAKNIALQNELNTLKANQASGNAGIASSFAGGMSSAVAFDAAAAKTAFGKKIKENDLTIVEGIGPKIQELFHNHDVKTWVALSQCSVEKCQEVLDSGGARFKMHKPTTWPQQAGMAAEGKWAELKKWQDELDGGN